jgi:hypothetical protein
MKLDQQVEQYLAEPVRLIEIRNYRIERSLNDLTVLTVEIVIDPDRFEKEE